MTNHQNQTPGYTTLVDPHDTSAAPDLRTWATIDEARAYALAQLDLTGLGAVAIGNADGSDIVEFVRTH